MINKKKSGISIGQYTLRYDFRLGVGHERFQQKYLYLSWAARVKRCSGSCDWEGHLMDSVGHCVRGTIMFDR